MRTKGKTSTNDILELYETKGAKLTVRKLDKATLLIEGDSTAFEFLGELLIAHARSNEHSLQISPRGAGSNRFGEKSTLGFYFHKLPCSEERPPRRIQGSKAD